jgi:hypothetical protein
MNSYIGTARLEHTGNTRTAFFEPRHLSWFGDDAELLLRKFSMARVAADPALLPDAARPGGWPGAGLFPPSWIAPAVLFCIFWRLLVAAGGKSRQPLQQSHDASLDNTASGALANALELINT